MNTADLINQILLGGLLGTLGQGIRLTIGLKKLNADNVTKALTNQDQEEFSTSRLLISIFIGFIAGAIAVLVKNDPNPVADKNGVINKEFIVMIIAAGYSGADFIEGAFKTYLKKIDPQSKKIDTANGKSDQAQTSVPDESQPNFTQAKG